MNDKREFLVNNIEIHELESSPIHLQPKSSVIEEEQDEIKLNLSQES